MQSTVKCTQGCSSSHSRCFCGHSLCGEHCPVPPRCLYKNLLSQRWGMLLSPMTERCRHAKVWSSQPNTEPPRGTMGLTKAVTGFGCFILCLLLLPSPPLHRRWLFTQQSAWKLHLRACCQEHPTCNSHIALPLPPGLSPRAPRMTILMAALSAGFSSPLVFQALAQGQGEEKASLGAVWGLCNGLGISCIRREKGLLWSMQGWEITMSEHSVPWVLPLLHPHIQAVAN